MDKKNAVFRAKLEERKKNQVKRIDHPLLRYNEKDQPICKVCDVVLKSDLHWDAHQVSAKHHQDDVFWDASDEVVETSDLDREWEKRREGFHTIGYRDGIIAGKEASAQEGFNFGFKESVNAGYRWGLVRGITSALALLPDGMKEKMLETDTKKIQLQRLFESTSSVSTTDALKSFHDDIISKKRIEDGSNMTTSSPTSECLLDEYYRELTLLVKESPAIKIRPLIDPKSRQIENWPRLIFGQSVEE